MKSDINFVYLSAYGAPHLKLYEDGKIFDTLKNEFIKSRSRNKVCLAPHVYESIDKLVCLYFTHPKYQYGIHIKNAADYGYSYLWVTDTGKIWNDCLLKWTKPYVNKDGYYVIHVMHQGTLCTNALFVHQLVMLLFYGIPEKDENGYTKVVNHIDCNKQNNRLDNLEYCSQFENVLHSRKNGNSPYVIKESDVYYICEHFYILNERICDIARQLDKYPETVKNVTGGHCHRLIRAKWIRNNLKRLPKNFFAKTSHS